MLCFIILYILIKALYANIIQLTCNLNIVFILGITVDRIKKFLNFLFTEKIENVTIKEVVVEYSLVWSW